MPNHSSDRRIGVNIQFVSTDVRQVKHDEDSAILVRGVDDYRHFKVDAPALRDMHPDDLARRDLDHEDSQDDGVGGNDQAAPHVHDRRHGLQPQ